MLTVARINNAKKKEKPYKLFDGGGLFLLITSQGSKLWRMKFRIFGKEKLLSFGSFPEISLVEAREKRDEARKQIRDNIDPVQARKAAKPDTETFELVASEWFEKFKPSWSIGHAEITQIRLKNDVYPWIGKRLIAEIKSPELLQLLRRIESRGAVASAHRVRDALSQIFRYGVSTGRCENDPASSLRGALAKPKRSHFASLTNPSELAPLLRKIDAYKDSPVIKAALQLQSLTFVRSGELRLARWDEFDLENSQWLIPAERMKMKRDHIVPLAQQAIKILQKLKPMTKNSPFVFPSPRTPLKPISPSAMTAALRSLVAKELMTQHGFRSSARTILDEVLHMKPQLIEHQLAHEVKDALGRAYNRTQHLPERREMMELYAEYLNGLKQGAKVIPFRKQA